MRSQWGVIKEELRSLSSSSAPTRMTRASALGKRTKSLTSTRTTSSSAPRTSYLLLDTKRSRRGVCPPSRCQGVHPPIHIGNDVEDDLLSAEGENKICWRMLGLEVVPSGTKFQRERNFPELSSRWDEFPQTPWNSMELHGTFSRNWRRQKERPSCERGRKWRRQGKPK